MRANDYSPLQAMQMCIRFVGAKVFFTRIYMHAVIFPWKMFHLCKYSKKYPKTCALQT